ncbi:MAG: hypothetical protein JWM02_2260 [Frankiales bacterium]|nr:hypothetical protein [Frankiales bacterium]
MAFWRRDPERLDPYELGVRRSSDPSLGAFEPLPRAPRRVSTRRLLVYFVLGVIAIGLIRSNTGSGAPRVAGSCTKAAFAVDKTNVTSYGALRWSAAGPAEDRVAFAVDTSTLPTSGAHGLLLGPVPLTGCKASGRFGVPLPAGQHLLTVFTVTPDGTATVLGTRKITVDPP